jgi:4-amino-4-deoxy-L-arabinose transferase-like glycosyltransferase
MPHRVSGYGRTGEALLIFLVALVLFSIGLGEREFIGFESRFGLFAREMLQNGITPFPTVYSDPYPDYPATQTILIYLLSLLYGKLSIFTAVLPTAICAALTLALTYLMGALYTRSWGVHAVLLELATVGFLVEARTISLDQMVTTCTVFTAYIACSRSLRRQQPAWVLLALGLVVGFAIRGPLGLALPATVLLACFMVLGEFRQLGPAALLAALLLVACMGLLLLAGRLSGGEQFVQSLIDLQFAKRMVNELPVPWYFYLTMGLYTYALSFPAALLVITTRLENLFGTLHFRQDTDSDRMHATAAPVSGSAYPTEAVGLKLFLSSAAWLLAVLVLLSIPAAKKSRYLLPAVPAMALLAASIFPGGMMAGRLNWLRRLMVGLFAGVPLVGLLAFLIAPFLASHFELDPGRLKTTGLVLLGLITLASLGFARSQWAQRWRPTTLMVCGVAAFLTFQIFVAEPVNLALERTQPFVARLERLRAEGGLALVFYHLGPDAEDIKYAVNMAVLSRPAFISTPTELTAYDKPALFIARQRDFEALPPEVAEQFTVIATGKLGHSRCSVFRRR